MIPKELVRPLAIVALLAVPVLSLLGFGFLWLWQSNLALIWSVLAAACAGLAWLISAKPFAQIKSHEPESKKLAESPPEPDWSPQDEAAWAKVCALAREIEPDQLKTQEGLIAQAQRTVELVARHYHPNAEDAYWRFTLPELLLLTENAAAGLRRTLHEQVPLSDQLRVSEIRWIYGWAPTVQWAKRIWDSWRVGRTVINPMGALAAEIRERIVNEVSSQGKQWVQGRLTQLFIEEIGRSAIDLYSGKLRETPSELSQRISYETKHADLTDGQMSEPLRIIVAGQTGVGKSSLINALLGEVRAAVDVLPTSEGYCEYRLERDDASLIHLVDVPAAAISPQNLETFFTKAQGSDLIAWVCAADRADRAADRTVLDALHDHFAQRPERLPPDIVFAATHVDRLRPVREWDPPYNIQTPSSEKAMSIRRAVDAIAGDLEVSSEDIIPVRLDEPSHYYNLDVLWAHLVEHLPEARKARLIRLRQEKGWDWSKILTQAKGAGRFATGALNRKDRVNGAS